MICPPLYLSLLIHNKPPFLLNFIFICSARYTLLKLLFEKNEKIFLHTIIHYLDSKLIIKTDLQSVNDSSNFRFIQILGKYLLDNNNIIDVK